MNRRGFIFKLAAVICGAPVADKLAPQLVELAKVTAPARRMTVWDIVVANPLKGDLIKTITRSSPYVNLLEAGPWPEGMGDAVRVITNEKLTK